MRLAVQRTAELRRILELPRRTWDYQSKEVAALVERMSALLRLPDHRCSRKGCAVLNNVPVVKLRPWQAVCLAELHDHGGSYCQAGVGDGKTLVSMLAGPAICADRILIVVPAELVKDTWKKFAVLREHWQYLPLNVVSYDFLSNHKNKDYLERFFRGAKRALFGLDEAHEAKAVGKDGSARGRRVDDFICAWREFEVEQGYQSLVVWDATGTPVNRSIKDCQPLVKWAIPNLCPLPLEPSDVRQWSLALDEKTREEGIDLGALEAFAQEALETSSEDLDRAVRIGLAKRLFDTPGMIAAPATEVPASLIVELVDLQLAKAEDDAFEGLRRADLACTPDGWPVVDEVERWRHARELSQGMFYVWSPRPPDEWIDARRAYHAAVRGRIGNNERKLYTKLQVEHEILESIRGRKCPECKRRTTLEVCAGEQEVWERDDEGEDFLRYTQATHDPVETVPAHKPHALADLYNDWKEVEPTFVPNTVPVWVGSTVLDYAAKWAKKEPGIVWVEHRAVGIELARRTGMPYHAEGGLDIGGRAIESARPEDGSIIASIESNHMGRNLQAWSRGLVLSCPPTGKKVQQLLGRCHRPGQMADVVRFYFLITCREQLAGFEQARKDCLWAGDMQQSKPKLALADIVVPEWSRKGFAWKHPSKAERKKEVRAAIEALRPE